ncbi:hypothetical protein BKA70DRAFT_168669 [Coprinopsis sp. MPI-PUGE-AT-0042]|nr:hypothetical protein BKA70DRAFT_168669 [Coprinopsis sp. MPI-PUGE-AT-0042]
MADSVIECIASLSPQLRALHVSRALGFGCSANTWKPLAEGVLALTFPNLESFTLSSRGVRAAGANPAQFWERHPKLKLVDVDNGGVDPLFPVAEVLGSLLPNLRYLTARGVDIGRLQSRLPRLVALTMLNGKPKEFFTLAPTLSLMGLESLRYLRITHLEWNETGVSCFTLSSFADFLIETVPNVEEIVIENGGSWYRFVLNSVYCSSGSRNADQPLFRPNYSHCWGVSGS